MNSRADISVVIPAYNHERFIGETLASLQAQTHADFEAVVIDDGSTDATAAIAEAVAANDTRFRVIRQPNGGSHAAINRGIAEGGGRWIAILNSDDRYAPGRLAAMRDAAADGARFAVGAVRLIDENGAPIDDPRHWWNRTMADFLAKADELGPIEGLMYGNYTVSTSNFFFERSLADAIGPLRPLRRVIDWDWALRAALRAPQGFRRVGGEPLLEYRLHGRNAILGDALRGTLEIWRMHRSLLAGLGVPSALVAAMIRNRRELRRAWRDRGVAAAERFVREREDDVATLRAELEREPQATRLARLEEANRHLSETADALRARLDAIEGSPAWRVLASLKRLTRPGGR